jgi:hypothetical protein
MNLHLIRFIIKKLVIKKTAVMCEKLFGQTRECIFAEPPLFPGWEPLPQKVNRSDSASKAGFHFHVNLQSYLHVAIQIIMVSEVDADSWDTFCSRFSLCA